MDSATFRLWREALGVDVPWLAARLGVNRRTVQRWERSWTPPDDAAEFMATLRDRMVQGVDDAVDAVLAGHEPGQPVVVERYLTEDAMHAAGFDMPLGMHAALIGHVAVALEAEGLRVTSVTLPAPTD